MRCYICNTYIEEPKIDSRDGKVRPCSHCEDEINEALADYDRLDSEFDPTLVDWNWMTDFDS